MKSRNYLWEQMDLPGESLPGEPLVEIIGTSRVLIENHCGVYLYGREQIGVRIKFGQILVCGACLELRCMTKDQLIISGKITGISFICREAK